MTRQKTINRKDLEEFLRSKQEDTPWIPSVSVYYKTNKTDLGKSIAGGYISNITQEAVTFSLNPSAFLKEDSIPVDSASRQINILLDDILEIYLIVPFADQSYQVENEDRTVTP